MTNRTNISNNHTRTRFLLATLFVFSTLTSFSQIEQNISGTWVMSGNNVYIYEFRDSGELVINDSEGNSEIESKDDSWEFTDDSLMNLTYTKGERSKKFTLELIEFNPSKMILLDNSSGREMIFHKVFSNNESNKDLSFVLQYDSHYSLYNADSIICKIKFEKDGKCLLYEISLSGGTTEYNSRWSIFKKDEGTFLRIDDFEIFLLKGIDISNNTVDLVPHGFLKALFGIETVRISEMD